MEQYGEEYAQVDASVVNPGISTMAMVSGNPEPVDGQSYVVVWIRWKYDTETGEGGFTGTGWYFDDPNNNIKKHYTTEQAFKDWLTGSDAPTDLDSVLGDWDADHKAKFLNAHLGVLENSGCIYFSANPQG